MLKAVFYTLVYLLTVFGAVSLVTYILNAIRQRACIENPGVRLVLMVKNQAENIEGIVRNIFAGDLLRTAGLPKKLTIVDMTSSDETADILTRLHKEYGCIDIVHEDEGEKLFTYFDVNTDLGKDQLSS